VQNGHILEDEKGSSGFLQPTDYLGFGLLPQEVDVMEFVLMG
jgi:hypothetical protein